MNCFVNGYIRGPSQENRHNNITKATSAGMGHTVPSEEALSSCERLHMHSTVREGSRQSYTEDTPAPELLVPPLFNVSPSTLPPPLISTQFVLAT